MIAYLDLEQGSIEWLEMKWGKIGGTASAGLYNDSNALFLDILSQRLEECEIEDSYSSSDMVRGSELEPFARQYIEEYSGYKFNVPGWLECEENELIGISPDGLTDDEKVACEIKCFGRKKHTAILLEDDIPSENIPQIIHYFVVNPNLEKLFFLCFRPESKKHFIRTLDRDSELAIGTKKGYEERLNPQGKMHSYVVTVPDSRKISEWVTVAKEKANILLDKIKKVENNIDEI